jgi:hypothetical protein
MFDAQMLHPPQGGRFKRSQMGSMAPQDDIGADLQMARLLDRFPMLAQLPNMGRQRNELLTRSPIYLSEFDTPRLKSTGILGSQTYLKTTYPFGNI